MLSQRPAAAVGARWLCVQLQLAPACSVFVRLAPGYTPSNCALQAQRPCLEGLPDALLDRVVSIIWDARLVSTASAEVRLVLLLEGVSRQFRQVLRAHPLRLRLNFSNVRLAERHLAWLALPAWRNRVEALTLHNWLAPATQEHSRNFLDPGLCTDGDVVSPLLTVLRANQRQSLRQLLGMPLRMGGAREALPGHRAHGRGDAVPHTPHVDVSVFHLTHLGVSGSRYDCVQYDKLPHTLVCLRTRAAYPDITASRWPPCTAAQAAARLPSLSRVHLSGNARQCDVPTCFPAASGWRAEIMAKSLTLSVDVPDAHTVSPGTSCTAFPGAKEVRIYARDVHLWDYADGRLSAEALADALCPPCLERMVIGSGREFPSFFHMGEMCNVPWRLVMRCLMHAREGRFAFEVIDGVQKQVAWRRWPAPGTPEHGAAGRLHARAAAWADADEM